MERRDGDRRTDTRILSELDPKTERRTANRRRLVRAGMLALMGAAGAKAHVLTRTHMLSDPTSEVSVSEQDFRVQEYDKAMLEAFAQEAADTYGVSSELVRAIIQAESGFRPAAVSRVGAQGPMQLMPTTAAALGVSDPYDARQNIFGGTKYLSKLLDRFNGNVALALAGYNAGPTAVARHKGIPPYGETRGYVRKIHQLVADTDSAFSIPTPRRARGRAVLKSRTAMHRAGRKDKRAQVSPNRSRRGTKAIAVKYKAPIRGARAGSRT